MQKPNTEPSISELKYARKLYCPVHGQKFMMKCEFKDCRQPYLCHDSECLQEHFHPQNNSQIVLSKLDLKGYSEKLVSLETMFSKENFASEAKRLKVYIDELKNSMVNIYKDYKDLHAKKDLFEAKLSRPDCFGSQTVDLMDDALQLGSHLKNSIDQLKLKIPRATTEPTGENSSFETAPAREIATLERPQMNGCSNTHQEQALKQISQKSNLETTAHIYIRKNKQSHSNTIRNISDYEKPSELGKCHEPIVLEEGEEIIDKENEQELTEGFQKDKNSEKEHQKDRIFEELFARPDQLRVKDKETETAIVEETSDGFDNKESHRGQMAHGSASQRSEFAPLKNRQNLSLLEQSFPLKRELTIFIEDNIFSGFSWDNVEELYSWKQPLVSVEKFHESLEGKKNLMFLFVGPEIIVGSYYAAKYPRLTERSRHDKNSLLFVSQGSEIVKFVPSKDEFQLSVSDKLYVCHGNTPSYGDGIRTFQRNFNSINYCLPSLSFRSADGQSRSYSGTMQVKQFYVFRIEGLNTLESVHGKN